MRNLILATVFMLITGLHIAAQEIIYGVSADIIAAYPAPNVMPLNISDRLLYDRIYRRVESSLAVYDGPSGNLVQDYGQGFNFVTLQAADQGEWVQISPDQWMSAAGVSEDVTISRYAGVQLPAEGLPYTMAWTLVHLYPAQEPGGDPSESNPFYYRYSRVNLYATETVDGQNWFQIGENQWVHQFHVARILPISRPEGVNTNKWVSADLYEQVLIAYEDSTPVFSTLIASGMADWPTNEGLFNVWLRKERTTMSGAYGQEDFYYLEEVPWTMYFDDDIALHGTYWHDGFGYRRSHGCVNMSITDANWIYNWSADVRDFTVENSPDLAVYVYSSGQYQQ